MSERLELRFTLGGTSEPTIIAHQHLQSSPEATYLTLLEGWDEDPTLVLNTVPKMNGNGSYLVSSSQSQRELSIEMNIHKINEVNLRTFRQTIIQKMVAVELIEVRRIYPGRQEWIQGYITAITGWEQINNTVTLKITVTCLDPQILT